MSREVVENLQRDREVDPAHLVDAAGAHGVASSAQSEDVDELLMDRGQLNPQQRGQVRCFVCWIVLTFKHFKHLQGGREPTGEDAENYASSIR